MKRKLRISNLPPKVSADDLRELLEAYGDVLRMDLTDDAQDASGRSGYV